MKPEPLKDKRKESNWSYNDYANDYFFHFEDVKDAVEWLKEQINDSVICNNTVDADGIKIYLKVLIDKAFEDVK